MNDSANKHYIYLDTERDRQNLIVEIQKVRQEVLKIVETLPEAEWYTPRYDNWSLAALLGYLNLSDNISMLLIQASLLGIRPALSTGMVKRLQHFTTRVFRRRLIATSTRSIEQNQQRIADFILQLPMNKFSTAVYDPMAQEKITVERALQAFFLHNWQHALTLIHQTEGIQPSQPSDNS